MSTYNILNARRIVYSTFFLSAGLIRIGSSKRLFLTRICDHFTLLSSIYTTVIRLFNFILLILSPIYTIVIKLFNFILLMI